MGGTEMVGFGPLWAGEEDKWEAPGAALAQDAAAMRAAPLVVVVTDRTDFKVRCCFGSHWMIEHSGRTGMIYSRCDCANGFAGLRRQICWGHNAPAWCNTDGLCRPCAAEVQSE